MASLQGQDGAEVTRVSSGNKVLDPGKLEATCLHLANPNDYIAPAGVHRGNSLQNLGPDLELC